MARALITIKGKDDRERAARWAMQMPFNGRIEFKETKRSLPQNSMLWSLLTDVARQVVWYGQKLTPTDWKDMFTASLRQARVVPGIDPGTFVVLGMRTSEFDKTEMSNMIELIRAFGAEHGVVFGDDRQGAA